MRDVVSTAPGDIIIIKLAWMEHQRWGSAGPINNPTSTLEGWCYASIFPVESAVIVFSEIKLQALVFGKMNEEIRYLNLNAACIYITGLFY